MRGDANAVYSVFGDRIYVLKPPLVQVTYLGKHIFTTCIQVLEVLKVELEHSMALSGCCNLSAVTKDLLIGPGGYGCQSKL